MRQKDQETEKEASNSLAQQIMYEQDRFMVRLRQRIIGESAIVAAWLSGSFGRNKPDSYSDIDVAIVFDSAESRDRAWSQRQSFCTGILSYVPAKSLDNPKDLSSYLVLYGTGTLVDFRYLNKRDLHGSWLDSEIRILKDDVERTAERVQHASAGLTKPIRRISTSKLAALDDKFYLFFWDTYRRVRRGSPTDGIEDYVLLISQVLPALLVALPKQSAARQNLIALNFSADTSATLAHLRQLVAAYRAARHEIVTRQQIDFRPNTNFEREIDRALQT